MDISAVVASLLGEQSLRIRPTSSPAAFFVDLPRRTVVAKLPAPGRPGSALVEAWAYGVAARRGARVPAVLGISDAPECIVIEAPPGRSLWSAERASGFDVVAWRDVGADLRAVHEIRLPGFGPLRATGPRGEADEWCPFARYARDTGMGQLVDAGYLSCDVLEGYGSDVVSRDDRQQLLPLYLLSFVIHYSVRMIDAGTTDGIREHLERSGYRGLL